MIIIELIKSKRQRKCNRCSEKVSEYYIYKDKVICKECLEHYLDLKITCSVCNMKLKRRNEYISDDLKTTKVFCSEKCCLDFTQDKQDMEELDIWLKDYHKVDKLNNRIFVQVNEFKKKYKFTTKGILLTLKYINTVLRKEIAIDNISIVQYYYSNAKDEYINKINREKTAEHLQENNYSMVSNIKKIRINYNANRNKSILITDLDLGE